MRRFAVLLAVLCLPAALAVGSADAAGCPNEALRSGPSAQLPACRAYEMVSPADKNGGNVSSTMSVHAAPNGEALSFGSTASFAGSPASPLGGVYIARRGSNWGTEAVDPPQFNHSGLLIRGTPMSSNDLRFSFGVSSMALAPGGQEGGSNLYLRDNATGARTLLTATPGTLLALETSGAGGGSFLGASADWSHILIGTREALPVSPSEPAPAAGRENLYDLTGGTAHLVNVLPGEIVDPSGAHIGTSNMPYQHLISEDGSKAFFQVGGFGAGPLYVREDGTTTTPISVSQNGAEAGEMEPAEFAVATPDGSIAYFTSTSELIEGVGTNALYRYDTRTGETTAVIPSPPAGGPRVRHVLGASQDGSYVYFTSSAVLAEGATEATDNVNFYVWHDGTIKWIAQTESATNEFSLPLQWSVSPDGKVLGIASESALTGEDVLSPACPTDPFLNNAPEHCIDAYAYEFDTGRLKCVSCKWGVGPGGEAEWLPGRGFSELGGQGTHEAGMGDEYPRAALDDGTVFFETPNALSPRDVNGVGDVYAWREGAEELVSTGRGEQPSTFGDSTPDGSNVFFLTKQQLVKQDTDESTDVYDDRELGGLASQWPPETEAACKGEGCRGASSSPPAGLPQGAATVAGKAAPRSCTAIRAKAKKASRKARRLAKRARRSAKRNGANAQSRRLRRKATTARKRAHRIHQKAATCGRKG
jgi:hypothetical protein